VSTQNKTSWIFELYDQVSSKIVVMQKNLTSFSDQMDKAGLYLEDLGSKYVRLNALADGITRINDNFQSAMKPGLEFEQQIADLSAITGIAGKDLDELSKASREVGESSGLGAAGAAEAYKLLASNIDIASIGGVEGLKMLQQETIRLAQASGVDLPTAADTMANAINQFKLEAGDAARVINVLAAGAKYGASEVPDLAASLKYVGPVAGAAGVGIEQTVAALEILSQSGIKAMDAGTDLQGILVKMQTSLGMDIGKLGLPEALRLLQPRMKDVTFLTKTFGQENLKSIQTLLQNADAVQEMTDKVTGTEVAQEQAAIRTSTYNAALARQRAWFEDIKISAFNATGALIPWLSAFTEGATGIIMLLPGLQVAKDTISFLTNATKMQALWTKIATAAQWAWNAAMNANPIFLVVTGVAALVGAIAIAWNKFEGFRKFLFGFWETIKTIAQGLWDFAKGMFYAASLQWGKAAESFGKSISGFGSIGEAWSAGSKAGAASWASSNAGEKQESLMAGGAPSGMLPSPVSGMESASAGFSMPGSSKASGSSGGGRNVSISIQSLVQNLSINTTNISESAARIQAIVTDALVRAINDAELATS
jgi:TP901 family phage tail tape measure protein